ncbi:MAG: hypothetical protein AMXMBFR48_11490 [Ignavibacteriales bacterium]
MMNYGAIVRPLLLLLLVITAVGCGDKYSEEDKVYIAEVDAFRKNKDVEMRTSPGSPFVQDTAAHWAPLKYYAVDPAYKFTSILHQHEKQDTVIILGTKGEERKYLRYGYFIWNFRNNEYRINVYKGKSRSGEEYASLWFTDETTGNETYGVGRYIDLELHADSDHEYTIDFNLAYNPYCAYSSRYSCAIPHKEDYLPLAIVAGEKKFHD